MAQKDEHFQIFYKQLNPEQKLAVDTIDGPVMVIAGPGTGKTTILTLRIANILRLTDTPAHGILAITYTDAGVKAIRAKLHSIIGNRAHDVYIHTFHSFAASIIAEYPDHFLHLDGTKIMTEIEEESVLNSILAEPVFAKLRPTGKPDAYVQSGLRAIEDAKRQAMTPKMMRDFAREEIERLKNDQSSISTRGASKGELKAEVREAILKCERTILFSDVYEKYENKKRELKLIDFNDLIIELLVALQNDELLTRLIQERFLYIHIDEHQDTNDAQNFIVALIAEFFETPNIFIVGDEKQAIYRFQGASVENFLLLQKRYPAMKIISLNKNYRSHQSILDGSFGMIEKNYEGDEYANLRVHLKSYGSGVKKPIDVINAENASAMELYLLNELKNIAKQEPKSTCAIIVRRNRELDRIIRLLESEGIAVSSLRSVDIFNHPVGRLFFDLIEYLNDPTRVDALAKTIVAGMWGISFEKGVEIIGLLRSGRHIVLEKNIPALQKIKKEILNDSPTGFIIHVASQSNFIKLIAKDPSYINVWRGIVALSESLVRDTGINEPAKLLELMLDYRAGAESRAIKVAVGAPDASIKAMTAHGSKGLEFDYVFISYATEEAWVGKPRGSSFVLPKKHATDSDIRDIRRLFYVALTRARKHVTILTPLEESDGKKLTPLRFILELDQNHVRHEHLPRAGIEEFQKKTGTSPDDLRQSKIIDFAKHSLLENGLSVTSLNHFIKCPNEFLYLSVLKLPQAPGTSAEKGNAMHFALSEVWKSKKREQKNIEKIILDGISTYLKQSSLPMIDKEAVKNELIEAIPDVAKALAQHFSAEGKVLTEYSVKAIFEGDYKGTLVHIPIHGKLDAIIENQNEVLVFDYKTKQAMSETAIKGETKNTDGGYFRQLVFYKFLLNENPNWRGKKINPALVFVSPDSKGRCPIITLPIASSDITKVKEEIQSLIDSVWSGKIATARCDDVDCEWCGFARVRLS